VSGTARGDPRLRTRPGAGTQALTFLLWSLLLGTPSALTGTLLMGASSAINLAVAEWIICLGGWRGSQQRVAGAQNATV
jgi:hypothetical protein